MKHLRADYDRIQDPEGKIGEDEPVFLLRAKDAVFMDVLRYYASLQRQMGNAKLATFVEGRTPDVQAWIDRNGQKQADVPDDVMQVPFR